jgi:SAM-dependent methyltransferase
MVPLCRIVGAVVEPEHLAPRAPIPKSALTNRWKAGACGDKMLALAGGNPVRRRKMSTTSVDGDYVLGTGDGEVARLGLQHLVWRPRALDVWRRAGFTVGQTLLDVGCGPGHASVDLAEIVGPTGRVVAFDRCRHFLEVLRKSARVRGLNQLTACEADLGRDELPEAGADGAWCRWVLSFVSRPRDLLARVAGALRPGGVLVLHEYFDYGTWRILPRCPEFEEFVRAVMESWRANGGEPDVGLELPAWLGGMGFDVRTVRPLIDVVPPSNFVWQWPKTFLQSGLRRLVQLGHLSPDAPRLMAEAFARSEAAPHALMVTPAVLEVIAVRP